MTQFRFHTFPMTQGSSLGSTRTYTCTLYIVPRQNEQIAEVVHQSGGSRAVYIQPRRPGHPKNHHISSPTGPGTRSPRDLRTPPSLKKVEWELAQLQYLHIDNSQFPVISSILSSISLYSLVISSVVSSQDIM